MPDHLQEKTCRARDEFGPDSPLSKHRRSYGQQIEHIFRVTKSPRLVWYMANVMIKIFGVRRINRPIVSTPPFQITICFGTLDT